MNFPPAFLAELKQRARVDAVIAKRIPLIKKGREFHACCPFHSEKTPSFTINPQKNFYHCFGCGAHGDALNFLIEHDKLTFPEAVRQLAAETGLRVPEMTAAAQQQYDHLKELRRACAAAAEWFAAQLRTPQGQKARAYLDTRGLRPETVTAFQLGHAPDGWDGLKTALGRQGFSERVLLEAGLLIRNNDTGRIYDRFRGRLMFPVTDINGQVVAFGGRSLDGSEPKYLNSPETPLFHKGSLLYNYAQARNTATKSSRCLIVEGYMDVIALHQGGFPEAVAPLGTALTEDQLQLAWRLVNVPTLCFDGDQAGQRAAGRALERALPLLQPGQSLQFVALPTGEDPDSLIRQQGAAAFQAILERSRTLEDQQVLQVLLAHPPQRPENRAAALAALKQAAEAIKHPDVRPFYAQAFRERFYAALGQNKAMPGQKPRLMGLQPAGNSLAHKRYAGLLLGLIQSPELACELSEELATLQLPDAGLDKMRVGILMAVSECDPPGSATVTGWLHERGFADGLAMLNTLSSPMPPADCRDRWLELVALRRTVGKGLLSTVGRAAHWQAGNFQETENTTTPVFQSF